MVDPQTGLNIHKDELLSYQDERLNIIHERDYMVIKSNEIIRKTKFNMSSAEMICLNYIISKIKPTQTSLEPIEISIKDFCKVTGLNDRSGGNYENIKERLKSIADKSVYIQDEKGDYRLVRWLDDVEISPSTGKVRVTIANSISPYVLNLINGGNYTQYALLCCCPMKSAYSIRLYEELLSYKFMNNVHEVDLEDLKERLMCKHITNFKDFRRIVLDKAQEEINRFTDLEVSWEIGKKQGKKVVSIFFIMKKKNSVDLMLSTTAAQEALDAGVKRRELRQLSFADILNVKTDDEDDLDLQNISVDDYYSLVKFDPPESPDNGS